ncbi:hypothetical protein ABK040_004605 [Willaertia magna]
MKKQLILFGIGALLFDYFYINKSCEIKPISLSFNPFTKTTNTNNNTTTIAVQNEENNNFALLERYKDQTFYEDHFVTELVITGNNSINNYNNDNKENGNNEITIEDLAKAFFTSPVFTPELNLISTKTKDEINNQMKFIVGESIGPFEITKSENNEILFHAKIGANSLTWLKVVKVTKNSLSKDYKSNNNDSDSDSTNNKYELHFGSALFDRSLFGKMIMCTFLPFHYIYSRYLLAGAKRRLQQLFDNK